MANETILLLQDSESPNVSVLTLLIRSGYVLHPAATIDEALYRISQIAFDLIIVNLNREDADCPRCSDLRAASDAPILLLGSMDRPETVARALANGADVYLPANTAVTVIEAYIAAMLRRFTAEAPGARTGASDPQRLYYRDDDLTVDLERRYVTVKDAPVDLTPTEFQLLALLLQNAGRSVTYDQILTAIWGYDKGDHSHIHTHISNLRKKLGDPHRDERYIHREYGIGYSFLRHTP